MEQKYDRSAEDLGNSVGLEHLNLTVPDQQIAILFYITGLENKRREVTALLTGLGALLMLGSGGLSLAWWSRLA